MYRRTILTFLIYLFVASPSWSAQGLPRSINVVTGVPLTLPDSALESMGLTSQENTGGWGDIMSNVSMALELKKQFPEISVRLLVTLNDEDPRQYANKVRGFILKILKNENGEAYLDPDSKKTQFYPYPERKISEQNIEIYFISALGSLGYLQPAQMTELQKKEVIKTTDHIPKADLGLQYSANDSPYSRYVVKGQNMQISFEEYSQHTTSHAYTFLQSGSPHTKLYSGPVSFGVYGFGSKHDALHSVSNQQHIEKWLSQLASTNASLKKFSLKSADFDLAFAYAGDSEMIEDYVSAVKQLAKRNRPTIIVYKGSGAIQVVGNQIIIPLGAHPKELGHALISESTYSPLVTGDGSLSSALETTSATKSFLYENIEWKIPAMTALLNVTFKTKPELISAANDLLIPPSKDLKIENKSRKDRIKQIKSALENQALHSQVHSYFSKRTSSLNIADNAVNMYQFWPVFNSIQKGFSKGLMFSESYLIWLTELTKTYNARNGIPKQKLYAELNDKVSGRSFQLLEKWFSLYTLWELGETVENEAIKIVVRETAGFFRQKMTDSKYDVENNLRQMLDQINASSSSKYALYSALRNDRAAYADFTLVREKYNEQSSRKLLVRRKNDCHTFYSN